MFKVLTGERKRRTITPASFAASLAAHLLLLGGVVYAADREPVPREVVGPLIDIDYVPEDPPAPPPPLERVEAPPAAPVDDARLPVPGDRVDLPAPAEVPEGVAPEAPGVEPVNPADYLRDGRSGDYVGPPVPGLDEPSGNASPPAVEDYVVPEEMVERRPVLDRSGLARALERYYPALLRDARVQGRVVVEMVVEEDGRVRPGSARVMDASHPAFGDAALRAVERFRFTPAQVGGVAVPVRVTVPIAWSVPR